MSLTVSELGALLLVLFAVFYWLGILPVVTAVIGFIGAVIVGTSGWLGRVAADVAGWVQHLLGTVTADLLGVSFVGILAVILLVIFIHDLSPKKSTGKRTAWIGVALGLLIAVGATGIPALDGLHSAIVSGASSALSLL